MAATIAECDAERAAKSLERMGPCPQPSYFCGLDMPFITLKDGRKVQVQLPEKERMFRQAEFER